MYSEPTIDPVYDSKYKHPFQFNFILKPCIYYLSAKGNNYASVFDEFQRASEAKYSNANYADIDDGPEEPAEPVPERMLGDLDESREDMQASNIKSEEDNDSK